MLMQSMKVGTLVCSADILCISVCNDIVWRVQMLLRSRGEWMFMEHEEGLFLFAEQTSVLQTVVPMCMIIMGILVNIACIA